MPDPKTPNHLKKVGATFWRGVVREYDIRDSAGLQLVTAASEALDRMQAAQATIAEHGEVITDRYGQVKVNPACKLENDARAGFLSCIRQLNLDLEPLRDIPGRPAGQKLHAV